MKPIDYRNETWANIQERLKGDRIKVLDALREHGPCTTRALASAMEWDILNVRPRVTELVQLHFADCTGKLGSEGVYLAFSDNEAETVFASNKAAVLNPQLTLQLSTIN